jgi:hypothetical protein
VWLHRAVVQRGRRRRWFRYSTVRDGGDGQRDSFAASAARYQRWCCRNRCTAFRTAVAFARSSGDSRARRTSASISVSCSSRLSQRNPFRRRSRCRRMRSAPVEGDRLLEGRVAGVAASWAIVSALCSKGTTRSSLTRSSQDRTSRGRSVKPWLRVRSSLLEGRDLRAMSFAARRTAVEALIAKGESAILLDEEVEADGATSVCRPILLSSSAINSCFWEVQRRGEGRVRPVPHHKRRRNGRRLRHRYPYGQSFPVPCRLMGRRASTDILPSADCGGSGKGTWKVGA